MPYLSEFIDWKKTVAGEIMTTYLFESGMPRISGRFNTQLSVRAYIGLKLLFVFLFSDTDICTQM